MMFKSAAAALMVMASATVWAQSNSPARHQFAAKMPIRTQVTSTSTAVAMHDRLQEMESTLKKMHALLKQMRTRTANSSEDVTGKANVEMWSLMLGHLDKQFDQLRVAAATQEDLEARRAALYKQAEAKAALARQSERTQVVPSQNGGSSNTTNAPAPESPK